MGQDLHIVGKALADLSDLHQHVKSVHGGIKQPRGDNLAVGKNSLAG